MTAASRVKSRKTCRRRKIFRFAGLCLLSWLATLPTTAAAQSAAAGTFVNRVFEDEQGRHKYAVFVPRDYSPDKSWPVILWLHGASARGVDGRAPLVAGLGPNVHALRERFPFLVVFPQCENLESRLLGGWTDDRTDADRALQILADVERNYRVDPRRRALTGVSMGAFGVWAVAARTPELWSALVPVSGGGPVELTETLKEIPVWAFHAADDQVVPPSASQTLITELQQSGGTAYYTELPNGGHNIGSRVFAKKEVYAWLLNPRLPPRPPQHWPTSAEASPQLQDEIRFVPGAEVDGAVRVQLGRDLLEALSASLPRQVPAEALQGTRGPQVSETESGWTTFQVLVSGVQYAGQVHAARLEPLSENRLRIRIGLQPLTMTILSTEIQGRILRAEAGAMQAVIGARRPVWLNLVIRPRIESRRLKLELLSAEFPIPADNWYVTEPNSVEVFPLPLLRDRISQRLTDGLYEKRGEIEQQVVAGVPKLLEQIEQRTQQQLDRVVTFGRWPMPVWQPRAKFWPSDVAVDAEGISLTLGITLAALAPQTETVPLKRYAAAKAFPPKTSAGAQLALAKDLISVWTELLAASDVRRFHANDFHARAFQQLADREFLSQVMPGRIVPHETSELRSVLSFEQPMFLEPLTQPELPQVRSQPRADSTFRLGGRELRLTVSERTTPDGAWIPVAEFPLAWSQDFQLALKRAAHRKRSVQLESLQPPQVESSGRWLSSPTPTPNSLHHELVAAQFRAGWEETFATAMANEISLPERVVAEVPLVCDAIGLQRDHLVISLALPTTQLQNLSRGPVTYQIRTDPGGWGEPHVLPAGMMHEFRATGPLKWRTRDGERTIGFLLPIGSVSQYLGGVSPLQLAPEEPAAKITGWSEVLIR